MVRSFRIIAMSATFFVAIDRTSKFAFAQLHSRATTTVAADFLRAPIEAALELELWVAAQIPSHFPISLIRIVEPGG
jgi:hypothetical protein